MAVRDALDSADLALEGNVEPTRSHLKRSAYFGRSGFVFLIAGGTLFIVAKRKEKKGNQQDQPLEQPRPKESSE